MRVQALSDIKHVGRSGRHYLLTGPTKNQAGEEIPGDSVTLPEEDEADGANWVKNGWAKNLDTGEQNAPLANPHTLVHKENGVSFEKAPSGTVPQVKPDDGKIKIGSK